ncbi:MAG: hypothetical protein ACI8XO_004176 [Verrucomicrobiales bacterium]|jgi:hypothetical protein
MRLLQDFPRYRLSLLKTFIACGLAPILIGQSFAAPVTAAIGAEPIQQASLRADSLAAPSVVSVLALSVAAITMVRRRVRN